MDLPSVLVLEVNLILQLPPQVYRNDLTSSKRRQLDNNYRINC